MAGYSRSTVRRTYNNPPLVEAVFEVRYQASPRDLLSLGQLAQALQKQFPIAEAVEVPKRGTLTFSVGDPTQKLLQLTDERRTLSISLGQGSISISAVKPGDKSNRYVGFETLQESASLALGELLIVNPELTPTRLGYRHINHIPVSRDRVNVGELLDVGIFLPDVFVDAPWVQSRFNLHSVLEYQGEGWPLSVALKLSTKTTPDDRPVLELDFDCFTENVPGPRLEDLIEWLNFAHDITGDIFESCITDRLRVEFNNGHDNVSG
jgi:uncharacterized protein (TIGR04255 family)